MFDPYKQQQQHQPNYYLSHANHHHHQQQQRQHRAVAGRRAVALGRPVPLPPPPPPQRVASPNCCSSSAATSSVVSEPISLDLATDQYYVKEKENWAGGRSRRVPPRPLRRTAVTEHEGIVIPLDGFRTKNYPQMHPTNNALDTSDDEEDEDVYDHRRLNRFDWHARRYSTSDLTTSDSEMGRFIGGNGKPYRLGIKCPSVSTINPDDSSLSFEDLDQQMLYQQPIKLGVRRYNRHQKRGVIGTAANFYNFDEDYDGTENCGAKSDAELTDRASSHRYHRSGNHRRVQRQMNSADVSPPPSRGTQSAPRTPQRHAMPPALEMIEEISPILPRPADVRDDLDIPPLPRPLKLSKEWRPLQTSTLTNFHATLPKTNPRHSSSTKLPPLAPLEPPRSLFDPQYTAMCCGTMSSSDEFKPIRSEQYNLPSVMAKAKGIRGILFLQLCVTGDSVLKVQIRNGAYFLKSLPISSFVKVEIRRSISNRRRDKYAHHHNERRQRFCSRITYPVSQSNQPEFYEEFLFRVTRTHLEHGDKLGISVFVQHSGEEKTPELLGGMSFSLVKMMKMAQLHTTSSEQRFFHYDDHQSHLPVGDVTVKLYDGGFFLLPDKKALTTKFAQDKISIRKYYDDIGGSTTMSTTASSSMGSPFRMMSEPEWTAAASARFVGLGGVAPNFTNGGAPPPAHQRRLFSPARNATTTGPTKLMQHNIYYHHHQPAALLSLAPTSAMLAPTASAAAGAAAGESSAADTSHYTTSNNSSSSSGAQSAVDRKRTRGGTGGGTVAATVGCPTVLDLAQATGDGGGGRGVVQSPPAVPPPSVNTTDTTTSDFTSSGFTSSAAGANDGIEMIIGQQPAAAGPAHTAPLLTTASLANSFSSGCAEVGAIDGSGADRSGSSSSDESSSSSSGVVIELATNIGPTTDGQQLRKSSLQNQYSPLRMHRGGGGSGAGGGCVAAAGNRMSPQKVAPASPPLKQQQHAAAGGELIEQYNHQQQHQQQQPQQISPSKRTKGGGAGGRFRTALAATTDNTMMRRVASFTFSPPRSGSLQHNNHHLLHMHQHHFLSALSNNNKHNASSNNMAVFDKRNSVANGCSGIDKLQRRMALGPLSKTLHFLRTKLDFSMSASVLCPSREECRLWQESFDTLLAHKCGCLLFREFLQSEFSEENLDFWLECEQFKRMKPGKKSTVQKANQIVDTFVKELAPKEVNLDSQTRLATQAALSVVPLRADMFILAQQKICQLMAKDSYPRFLKSEQYLELLNNNNNDDEQEQNGAHQCKGLLRVASAREGCSSSANNKSTSSLSGASSSAGGGGSRSPSVSPRSGRGGTRWNTRRNTCAPIKCTTTPTTTTTPALLGMPPLKNGAVVGNGTTMPNLSGTVPTPLTLQIPSSIAE